MNELFTILFGLGAAGVAIGWYAPLTQSKVDAYKTYR